MKAQASIEYMMIVIFGILAASLLWVYASSNIESNRWEIELAYAENSVSQVVNAADTVYMQGPPAKIYIYPNFPEGISNISVSGNTITIQLLWEDGIHRNVTALSVANITGNLSAASGTHKILVQAVENYVMLEE